ncbi:MAG: hypothetical protein IJJ90_00740 [Prevotella sp.]|nr:hypothetical protein [Prevotella sp.]
MAFCLIFKAFYGFITANGGFSLRQLAVFHHGSWRFFITPVGDKTSGACP